jgi:hypothetical protein
MRRLEHEHRVGRCVAIAAEYDDPAAEGDGRRVRER